LADGQDGFWLVINYKMFEDKDIWLVSHSPRRIQLLTDLGLKFHVGEAHVDEVYPDSLTKEEIPMYLSHLKATHAECVIGENTIVITADTIVWADDKALGKPSNAIEAADMLRLLSGRTHQVVTGVTFRNKDGFKSFYEETDVTFRPLSSHDIDYYISNYQPFDKAGAYGIQEWIGMIGVESINGCFYNVMGLPVSRLYKELLEFVEQ